MLGGKFCNENVPLMLEVKKKLCLVIRSDILHDSEYPKVRQ